MTSFSAALAFGPIVLVGAAAISSLNPGSELVREGALGMIRTATIPSDGGRVRRDGRLQTRANQDAGIRLALQAPSPNARREQRPTGERQPVAALPADWHRSEGARNRRHLRG